MAVFQRGNNWWIGYPLNGKYRREKVGANHTLARDLYAKRLAEVAERRFFPARSAEAKKFDELAEQYWQLHAMNTSSKSWAFMLTKIRQKFGQMNAREITPFEVEHYLNEIAARTSNATSNHYLTLFKAVYTKARRLGIFRGDDPCANIRKKRTANHRLRFLSKDEIAALLAAAHPRLYPFLVAAISTGMRKGELLSLRWENVSLERSQIYILKSKSGKPREIPITNGLARVLMAMGPKAEGSVFGLPDISARRYFDRARIAAKLPARGPDRVTIHTLRHSFASHFIMQTQDLPTLQRLLGHATPQLTMIYAHLSCEHVSAGMARFEAGMPTMTPGCDLVAPALLDGAYNAPESNTGSVVLPGVHLA